MDKKSFFLGVLAGVVLTFVGLFVIGMINKCSRDNSVQYLETPVSYENKTETSFKVFHVFEDSALACEKSGVSYLGNTVLIVGENFYSDQVITVKNPQRIGSYSYTIKGGIPMTVPVIVGDME